MLRPESFSKCFSMPPPFIILQLAYVPKWLCSFGLFCFHEVYDLKKICQRVVTTLHAITVKYMLFLIYFFLLAHSHIVVVDMLSCVQLSSILWTIACQAPLSMEFSRQEYWSGLPFPPPEDLPDAGIEPESSVAPALQIDFLPAEPWGSLSCVDPGFLPNNLATLL